MLEKKAEANNQDLARAGSSVVGRARANPPADVIRHQSLATQTCNTPLHPVSINLLVEGFNIDEGLAELARPCLLVLKSALGKRPERKP